MQQHILGPASMFQMTIGKERDPNWEVASECTSCAKWASSQMHLVGGQMVDSDINSWGRQHTVGYINQRILRCKLETR